MTEAARGAARSQASGLAWRLRFSALPLAGALVIAAFLLAVCIGPVKVPLIDVLAVVTGHLPGIETSVDASTEAIVWQIRIPRVLLAGVVGASLALAGAAYQGVFRNPLADPYLLGIASGAGLAQTVVIIAGVTLVVGGFSFLTLAGFAGSMTAVLLAYGLARVNGQAPATTLVLAGVAISSANVSAISYLMLAHQESASSILTLLLGSLNRAGWAQLGFVLPYMLPAALVIFAHGRLLNVLQLSEDEARQSGLDVERTRLVLLVAASLATAAAVSVAGVIGFVGLIVPHAVRLLIGPDYRRLLPIATLFGAGFLMLADMGSRVLIQPSELPVGVITSFTGVPFFLYLLRRQRKVYF